MYRKLAVCWHLISAADVVVKFVGNKVIFSNIWHFPSLMNTDLCKKKTTTDFVLSVRGKTCYYPVKHILKHQNFSTHYLLLIVTPSNPILYFVSDHDWHGHGYNDYSCNVGYA